MNPWNDTAKFERYATTYAVAKTLGIDTASALELQRAGVLGERITLDETGKHIATPIASLTRRASTIKFDASTPDTPPALIVNVGRAARVSEPGDTREWAGFHMGMDDDTREAATNRYWPIDNPEAHIGKVLVVSMHTLVVRVRLITGARTVPGLGAAFATEPVGVTPYRLARTETDFGQAFRTLGPDIKVPAE